MYIKGYIRLTYSKEYLEKKKQRVKYFLKCPLNLYRVGM